MSTEYFISSNVRDRGWKGRTIPFLPLLLALSSLTLPEKDLDDKFASSTIFVSKSSSDSIGYEHNKKAQAKNLETITRAQGLTKRDFSIW